MNRADLVRRRKGKYMAQVLERFETVIEPHLGSEHNGEVQSFKGLVRARMNALSTDAIEIMSVTGEVNEAATELKDRLSPTGRP